MRLFIAINFNDATRSELLALRDALKNISRRGNYTAVQNLHLTLAFLGECDEKQAAAAKAAMESTGFDAFGIAIARVGRFKRSGGDIWWAGVNESEALQSLWDGLSAKLRSGGFSLDARGYSPHITLGREVATNAAPWSIEPFGETVRRIDLMKSERIGGALTYTSIYSIYAMVARAEKLL